MAEDDPAPGEVLMLSRTDVTATVRAEDCFERVEDTFRWIGEDRIQQVNPIEFWVAPPEAEYGWGNISSYPAYIEPLEVAGHKWLGAYRDNAARGLPTINAVNIVSDAATAQPLAIMDGQSVTSMRTAGHAGVGAKHLARADSSVVTIVGCGEEGRTHLRVMEELFDIEEVHACDIDDEVREAFIEEMGGQLNLEITGFADTREAVKGADIVCMVTTAKEPIVEADWIEPGTHVAATNCFNDLDPAFSRAADKWFLGYKHRDHVWIEEDEGGGDPDRLDLTDVDGDMVELLAGEAVGRESPEERTVMTHLGMPALDAATSHFVYEKAKSAGRGSRVTLFE